MSEVTIPIEVEKAYGRYDKVVRDRLIEVRRLIFDVAAETDGVGALTETLKWGEPAYLTEESKSGTTIRLGETKQGEPAVFFNCRTTLVESFRERFPDDFRYDKNRALIMDLNRPVAEAPLAMCLKAALTYHRR